MTVRRLPRFRYLLRLWSRSVVIYVLLRGVVASTGGQLRDAMGEGGSPWDLTFMGLAALLTVVGWLVVVFARRRKEMPWIWNLGINTSDVVLVSFVPVLLLELFVQLVL